MKAKEHALTLVQQERQRGNNDVEYIDQPLTAARGMGSLGDPMYLVTKEYPNGAPSLRTFLIRGK
jgi:hypothetical protein